MAFKIENCSSQISEQINYIVPLSSIAHNQTTLIINNPFSSPAHGRLKDAKYKPVSSHHPLTSPTDHIRSHTHKHTHTQKTHKHTNTHTHKHTNTQTHKHTNTQTHKHTNTQTHKPTNTQTHKHTNTQTH